MKNTTQKLKNKKIIKSYASFKKATFYLFHKIKGQEENMETKKIKVNVYQTKENGKKEDNRRCIRK